MTLTTHLSSFAGEKQQPLQGDQTTSDQQIELDACYRLRHSGYAALANLTCRCKAGMLTLTGTLPSFYLKQVAQETVRGLESVDRVVNRVRVRCGKPRRSHCA